MFSFVVSFFITNDPKRPLYLVMNFRNMMTNKEDKDVDTNINTINSKFIYLIHTTNKKGLMILLYNYVFYKNAYKPVVCRLNIKMKTNFIGTQW